ncbi:MAG TPA: hypothetical protein VFH54_19820 [Mycobacteriales bacterium]|nr:hypothetical protein [Mycobacteriales bacterium]
MNATAGGDELVVGVDDVAGAVLVVEGVGEGGAAVVDVDDDAQPAVTPVTTARVTSGATKIG